MVSSEVWEAMKSAVGFYGTGAGTVFWRKYLDFYTEQRTNQLNV